MTRNVKVALLVFAFVAVAMIARRIGQAEEKDAILQVESMCEYGNVRACAVLGREIRAYRVRNNVDPLDALDPVDAVFTDDKPKNPLDALANK